MQRSLILLVQKSIDAKYTNVVRNRITGQLPVDIRLIMNHLFKTYGKINEQELQTKFDETTTILYSISEPVNDIFYAVDNLVELAKLAGCPYTTIQQVNMGYLIVSK